MTTTFKPGQIAQHPEHGYGTIAHVTAARLGVTFAGYYGTITTSDLTGWKPAEVVKPGHVQVRVDDLEIDPKTVEEWASWRDKHPRRTNVHHILARLGRVLAEQQTLTEPVRLMHPEPTERGAKASIYHEDGSVDRLLRAYSESTRPWADDLGRRYSWDEADAAGTLIPGWGDEEDADEPVEVAKLSHPEPMRFAARASYIDWETGERVYLVRLSDLHAEAQWHAENSIRWDWDELVERDGNGFTLLLGWGDGQ